MSPFITPPRRRPRSLGPDVKLSLGVGAVCLIVGAAGYLANLITPETTLLDGFLIVALFYLSLGAGGVIKRRSRRRWDVAPSHRPVADVVIRATRWRPHRDRSLAS